MYLGWVDEDYRWHLPVHQPVEDTDFVPAGMKVGNAICGVCSYDPKTGHPATPIEWPCQDRKETPLQYDGKYRPRTRRGHPRKEKP